MELSRSSIAMKNVYNIPIAVVSLSRKLEWIASCISPAVEGESTILITGIITKWKIVTVLSFHFGSSGGFLLIQNSN